MINFRQLFVIAAAALMAASLSSCGSTGGSHLMYVSTGQGIYAYRIDDNTGSSTAVFTTPFIIGNAPAGMVLSPSGQVAYAANQNDDTISQLKIDTVTGTLTEVLPRTPAGFSPNPMVMDAAGGTLIVGNQLSNDLYVYTVGANGALTLASKTPLGSQPTSLVLSNNFLYVAVPNFNGVYGFSLSSGNLSPLPGTPVQVLNGIGKLAVDPAGKYLYAPNLGSNTISGFAIQSDGSLVGIPNSPFLVSGGSSSTPPSPAAALADATSTHLYVANFGATSVAQFSIGTNGALTAMTPATVSAGTNPAFMLFDPFSSLCWWGTSDRSRFQSSK